MSVYRTIGPLVVCLFVVRLNIPVNNFSVMSGRSVPDMDKVFIPHSTEAK